MTTKLSALIVCITLVFSLANPPRAGAISEGGEIAIYVVAGIVGFVGAVVLGTMLTRDESKLMLQPQSPHDEDDHSVSFGLDCKMPDGRPAVLCW